MKHNCSGFVDGFKRYPVLRGVLIFAAFVTMCEIIAISIMYVRSGIVPAVNDLDLLFWHWHMPFTVSRLWDILLLPSLVYLTYLNESRREEQYYNSFDYCSIYIGQDYSRTALDMTQVHLCLAMIGASIFGIIYALPLFIVLFILEALIGITRLSLILASVFLRKVCDIAP